LENWAETFIWAWNIDRKDPKTYPMTTSDALFQLKGEIEERLRPRKQEDKQNRPRMSLGLRFGPPKHFAELINDRTIKAVYEDQNADSYKNALQRAARGDRRTFRKILRAIEGVYAIDRIGMEAAPRPKVHLLHWDLFDIAKLIGLRDLTDEGMQEFLDDLCPCGKPHNPDAVRKLRKRWARSRA
jgi:hypothetical protein